MVLTVAKADSRKHGHAVRQPRRGGDVRDRAVQGAQADTGGTGGPLQADEVYQAGNKDYVQRI